MRRKLLLAIVGVTAAALLITGLGTLLLVRRASRNEARQQLLKAAQALTAQLRQEPLDRQSSALALIRKAANIEDGEEVVFSSTGAVLRGQLPPGVTAGDLHVARLLANGSTSGALNRGGLVYAAVVRDLPTEPRTRRAPDVSVAVVLTRKVRGAQRGVPYFLLTAAIVLVIASLVAGRLVRRITHPLRDAEEATRRIAAGQLDTRLPVAPADYPELSSLTGSINTMAESLSRSRQLERQFLLSVSHDLRTPLTSIRGFAEAISDGTATDVDRAASVIAAESRRLERLVRDLLDLARLEARAFALDVRATDVSELVLDTTEGFRPAATHAGLALEIDVAPDLAAEVDPDRLAQVVANLVENAFKFAKSRIHVTASAPSGGVEISVTDDGPGVPSADLPRVFERLYQSVRTPARQAGSGLGLAIVAELTQAMGGQVRAVSPVDAGWDPAGPEPGGTRMIVALTPPARTPPAPTPPAPTPPARTVP